MHPYRDAPPPAPARTPPKLAPEDWFLVGLLVVVGAARVIPALVSDESFEGDTTLALLGLALGLWFGMRGVPSLRGWLGRRAAHRRDCGEPRPPA